MPVTRFRGAVEWALMVGLVFGAGALAQAQNDEAQSDAKIVRIGPSDGRQETHQVPGEGNIQAPEMPKYWIGLLGYEQVPAEVRHHIDLPENQGVMVRDVRPNSPAAKSGLEQYDILLRANDTELHEMNDLRDLVRTQGEQKGQITLEVLRHGKRDTVYVTPEETPADLAQQMRSINPGVGVEGGFPGGIEGLPGELQQLFGQNGPEGAPRFNFRHFGPGVIVDGNGAAAGVAQMPNGVSISVQKNDGEPTKVTVKRGNESWEVNGDDPESLKALPEDLRPFVDRMIHGGGQGFNIEMPQFGNMPHRPSFDGERLRERLEAMERRLEEMQKRFGGPAHDEAKPAQPAEQAE